MQSQVMELVCRIDAEPRTKEMIGFGGERAEAHTLPRSPLPFSLPSPH